MPAFALQHGRQQQQQNKKQNSEAANAYDNSTQQNSDPYSSKAKAALHSLVEQVCRQPEGRGFVGRCQERQGDASSLRIR